MLALTLLLSSTTHAAYSQIERNKRLEKSFSGKEVLALQHRHGNCTVRASDDGRIHYEAVITVEGRDESDVQSVLNRFEIQAQETGRELSLNTDFGIRSWNKRNNDLRLEFRDGATVRNLRDIKVEMTVYIPQLQELRLENKYNEIRLETDPGGTVRVNIHSGQFEAERISGDFYADLKYSKGEVEDFGNAELSFYDSDFTLGNGRRVQINSKYSKLELGNTEALTIDAYDDELEIGNVRGMLILQDKYSDIELERFQSARMDLYDSNLNTEGGEDLQIKSKYSNIDIESLDDLQFELSYDDKVEVETLGSLVATSKYTDFGIGTLRRQLKLNSYDDEIEIGEITGPLDGITFNGKYTDLSLKLASALDYLLEVDSKYGRFAYPDSRVEYQVFQDKNDELEFRGKTKGAGAESPKISIKSYDGKVSIE